MVMNAPPSVLLSQLLASVLQPEGLDSLLRWRFVFSVDSSHHTWRIQTSTSRVQSVSDQIRSISDVFLTLVDQDPGLR